MNSAYRKVRSSEHRRAPSPLPNITGRMRRISQGRYGGHRLRGRRALHTMPDERVDIVDYLDMIKIYLLTILDICDVA